jgi:putative membrane protein
MGFEILLWVLIAVFVVWLFTHFLKSTRLRTTQTPLDILKMRLAKGEITQEEFDKMKEHLK